MTRRDETGCRVSIFLPAYNAIDNLEGAVADIEWAAPQVLGDYEILIIDDGSSEHFSFLPANGEIARESVRDVLAAVGGADIVAPYHQNPRARQIHRRMFTWASTSLVNVLFRQRMHYYQGPCIYPLGFVRQPPKNAGRFYFLSQMLIHALHAGYSYVAVGLTHVDRTHGRSKAVSAKNILRALRTIAQAWLAIHVGGQSVARRG